MKNRGTQKGFTLIELVMVIAILGILATVALPKFQDLQGSAKIAATKGGLGAVRSAMAIRYAMSATGGAAASYPTDLAATDFSDGLFPKNQLNALASVQTIENPITGADGTTPSTVAGFWYISGTGGNAGRAGAYATGTVNTSDF